MFALLNIFNQKTLEKILKKLSLTFLITYIISWYVYENYSDLKFWNVPSGYEEKEKLTFEDIYYFQVITWFTIGYGDFTPKHPTLKMISVLNATIAYIVALT